MSLSSLRTRYIKESLGGWKDTIRGDCLDNGDNPIYVLAKDNQGLQTSKYITLARVVARRLSENKMGIRKDNKKSIFGRGQAQAVERNVNQPTPSSSQSSTPNVSFEPPKPRNPRGDLQPTEYIEQVINDNKIVLFMKGSPTQPLCGFCNAAGLEFSWQAVAHVDVIIDSEVEMPSSSLANGQLTSLYWW